MMRAKLALLAATLFAAPTSSQAAWNRASSEHFLIYSEQSQASLREFAEKLEKFDGAVRALRGMDDQPLSKGNRLTIFVVDDTKDIQRLIGDKSGFTAGFYRGSAEGSTAFVPQLKGNINRNRSAVGSRVTPGNDPDYDLGADKILLHEYSHHLMMQALETPYPEWLIEGFAEFMATASFERDGSVGLGLPAKHRAYGLLELRQLPLETLLSGKYEKITVAERESIYGRGWLLTHYLTFAPARSGQLTAYLTAIAKGVDPLESARQAFGDLRQLDRDITAYMRRSALEYRKVSGAALAFGPIEVSQLSPGGSAVMPLVIELKNGVPKDQRAGLADKVRAVQAKYSGDPLVEVTLSEAELDAERPAEAQAAADRALKADPRSTDAMILKGRAMMDLAKKAPSGRSDLFAEARKQFTAANRIDPEDPEPLMRFYYSYVMAGIRPTANAVDALHYASDLAPQDIGLRVNSALQFLSQKKLKEARAALAPIAFNPHGRETAAMARRMIAKIDAGDAKGAEAAISDGGS